MVPTMNAISAWFAAVLAVLALAGAADARTVRIGYQKYGQMIVVKAHGALGPALAAHGDTVEWKLFTAGPQLLEALDAGAIDVGITGDAPPVAAQANGGDFYYVGVEPPMPMGEAIVVPANSSLRTLADLRGKRVALNRASNVHWLLLRALDAGGLGWRDIRPVYLTPPDGRAAFVSGDVDAWAIWDPFLTDAVIEAGARVLHDGTGLAENRQFYLATRSFARDDPASLRIVLQAVAATDAWAASHRPEVAALLAPAVGLPLAIIRPAADRLAFGVAPVDASVTAGQQRIADAFLQLGLIGQKVDVAAAVWHDASH